MEGFKTKWNDEFDQTNEVYKLRNLSKADLDELKVIKKANIFVNIRYCQRFVLGIRKSLYLLVFK
jgi:hypothetical protein